MKKSGLIPNLLRVSAVLLTSVVLGVGSAWLTTSSLFVDFEIENGPWTGTAFVGDKDAGPYLKAYVARIGWFGLPASESLYVVAETDSDGRRLDADCDHTIEGDVLDARWWSLTAYKDLHWMSNPFNRYSFSKTSIESDANGKWRVVVSRKTQDGNWLQANDQTGAPSYVLRLYNPSPALIANLADVDLPVIKQSDCG